MLKQESNTGFQHFATDIEKHRRAPSGCTMPCSLIADIPPARNQIGNALLLAQLFLKFVGTPHCRKTLIY
jgi:hypothetical protein